MITPLTSSSREQQLAVIVTFCGPAATIEIMFTLIEVVAGPSVQVSLFHLLASKYVNSYFKIFFIVPIVVVV